MGTTQKIAILRIERAYEDYQKAISYEKNNDDRCNPMYDSVDNAMYSVMSFMEANPDHSIYENLNSKLTKFLKKELAKI